MKNVQFNTKQHWYGQWLLREFLDADRVLHALDKRTGKIFRVTDLRRVACAHGHFDFETDEGTRTADARWTRLESEAIPIVRRILSEGSVCWMQKADRRNFAKFIAAMVLGNISTKNQILEEFPQKVADLDARGENKFGFKGIGDEARAVFGVSVDQDWPEVWQAILDKQWFLRRAVESEYITSDNPVVRFSQQMDERGRFNLGIGAEGVHLMLPLSPRYLIQMCCRATVNWDELKQRGVRFDRVAQDTAADVERLNLLQMHSAERQAYASSAEVLRSFEPWFKKYPSLREPLRFSDE